MREPVINTLLQRTAPDPVGSDYDRRPDGMPPETSPPMMFLAIVTGNTAQNSNPTTQWTYKAKRVYKSATGYGSAKWTQGGDEITCYNMAENINSTSGRQGNSIDVDHLDIDDDGSRDYEFYPIQNNTPVLIIYVPVESTMEYWIVGAGMPNGVDGECP